MNACAALCRGFSAVRTSRRPVAASARAAKVLLAIGGVLAVILVVIALTPNTPYFLWALVLTPTVVLFSATSIADVKTTGRERLAFTLLGGALVLLASGIALGWAHYQQARSPLAAVES